MSVLGMALQATREAVNWVSDGAKISKDADSRMAVCASCQFYIGSRCQKCGCFMSAKTKMATSKCPIGKW